MKIGKKVVTSVWFFPAFFLGIYATLYFAIKDYFLFTPDYSSTDIFHYTISYKYYLWQSFRAGIIPWWTHLLGGGFPLLAESPMGMLFLPYYLIFPLFSNFSHAFAFLFCLHLYVMTIGTYLFLRELPISRLISFMLSLTFVWNGAITFRWVHFTVLQAFSFAPLLFWLYKKWNKKEEIKYVILFVLVLNQMILVGYIQAVFISLLGLCCLYIAERPHSIRKTLVGLYAIMGGVLVSLPQLIPTLQLASFTSRPLSNTYDFAVSVPFNLYNVCSFFISDCLGSAKNGSYNSDWQLRGVYWENTPYMGIFFMILILLVSIYILFTQNKNKTILEYLFLFILFLLLALGKNSPLYFLFSIFPFTMFRTPGRYLVLATFFLVTYSSLLLQSVIRKSNYLTFLIYTVLVFNLVNLVWTAFTYHVFVESSLLYKNINSQNKLPHKSQYITFGIENEWNTIFSRNGWKSKSDIANYIEISKAVAPNANLINGTSQFDIYASMPLRRNQFVKDLIRGEIESATTSAHLSNLLDLYGISTIVSYKPLDIPRFQLVQNLVQSDKKQIRTYKDMHIATQSAMYYIPNKVQHVKTIEDVEKLLTDNNMSQMSALAESLPHYQFINSSVPKITSLVNKDMYFKDEMYTSQNTFIVYKIGWYPEWELRIDSKKSPLYRTNLIHMGFFLPKGKHIVELTYNPKSLYIGVSISALFIGVSLLIFLKTIKRSK